MPQLDPSHFLSQVFWLSIVFCALYFVLARHSLPRIADVIETRRKRVSYNLDEAAALKAETDELGRQYDESLDKAKAEALEALQKTRRQISAAQAEDAEKLDKELQTKAEDAEDAVKTAKKRALEGLESDARNLVPVILDKLAGMKAPQAAVSDIVRRRAAEMAS